MSTRRMRRGIALSGLLSAGLAGSAFAAATDVGPSSDTEPYVLPVADGVKITSLLTVDDAGSASNGYEMVGIPDGLGLVEEKGRDFRLFNNHELRPTEGVVRRHGQPGAFVSDLSIDRRTLEVEQGQDLIDPGVTYWNYITQEYGPAPSPAGDNPRVEEDALDPTLDDFLAQTSEFARFCSSSITERKQLYNRRTGRGYKGQLYFANEENGDEGRSFGVTTDGQAQQLPRLGLFSWENTLAGYNRGDVTYTMGQEDSAAGQLHVYVGRKQARGNPFDRAGLTNGKSFVIDLANENVDSDARFRTTYGKGVPAGWDLGGNEEVLWDASGKTQSAVGAEKGLSLNRIEDGAFDPRNPADFYFVTTEGSAGTVPGSDPPVSRDGGGLWKLTLDDVERPWKGGTLTLLLDGSAAPYLNKPDNVTFDAHGHLMIQEDPGNNAQLARIVGYDVDSGDIGVVAEFDGYLFEPDSPGLITQDEESSGIIDVSKTMGKGWFAFDAQVHKASPNPEYVEYGQLLVMRVRDWRAVFGG